MNTSRDEYPNFELDENDLFNFEQFCESKYHDPVVQKFGFFKVHLHKDIVNDYSIEDFLAHFSNNVYNAIKETVILENPTDCGLYGHHNLNVPVSFKEQFMQTATSDAFVVDKEKLNCCMEPLEKEGVDAFLQHFYSELASNSIALSSKTPIQRNYTAITRKIPAWTAEFNKRQQFQTETSFEHKRKVLELAMQAEKFDESHKQKVCQCETCEYLNLEVPPHEAAPIGTLYSSGIEESYEKHVKLSKNFAMVHLCFMNMLSMLDSAFGGVSFPSLYVGTSHTVFPVHVEDLSLWSFNFLISGFPKFWIVVPSYAVSKLTDALTRCGFGGIHKTCRNLLGHKFYIPSVAWLISEDISFNVVIQREGEGVVLLPNAAHTGGNLGHNVAEACNFGTKSWIPYGCVYPLCTCLEDSIHADLTPIIAVHKKDLLKAYLNNNILSAATDDYFLKSVVLSRSVQYQDPTLASCSTQSASTSRLKCPLCPYTWSASIPKGNVLKHLTKYHHDRLEEEVVVKFWEVNFPKARKEIEQFIA